jgi:hypothetical protein
VALAGTEGSICDVIAWMSAPCRPSRMWALFVFCGLSACAPVDRLPAHVDRATAVLRVDPDGSLFVEDSLSLRFDPSPVTAFERVIPGGRTDGFTDIAASMDGLATPEGEGSGRVEITRGSSLRVRWHFADAAGAAHEFTLTYRAIGALEVKGMRGRLDWPVFGTALQTSLASASTELDIPAHSVLFSDPIVTPGKWRVSRQGERVVATRTEVAAVDGPVVLHAEMAVDELRMPVPQWQMTEDRVGELMPAFVSGGLFLAVIGLGAVAMLAVQYRRHSADGTILGIPRRQPAVAFALARRGRLSPGRAAAAAAMGLADQGRLVLGTAGGVTTLAAASAGEAPESAHETLVCEVLASAEAGRPVLLGRARAALAAAGDRMKCALEGDLVGAGFVSRDRVAVRRGLYVAGISVTVLGVLCAGIVPIMRPRYGIWPSALPIGIVFDGLLLIGYGLVFSTLTDLGAARADEVRQRLRQTRRSSPPRGESAEAPSISVAVGLGLEPSMARALQYTSRL